MWGRLDELQPTDVVNPLDVSRFFFEGRSEARLAVPLVRGDGLRGIDKVSIEGSLRAVLPPRAVRQARRAHVAVQRRAAAVPFTDRTPARTASNAQGGARVNLTTGRVDWSISAYRGFRTVRDVSPRPRRLNSHRVYPRFTMIGGDFETVAGPWVVRGEAAAFVRDAFQAPAAAVLTGQSFDAGVGLDRKAGRLPHQRAGPRPSRGLRRRPAPSRQLSEAGPMCR